jgi:hypothetical protein
MGMVKLSSGLAINPEYVASVEALPRSHRNLDGECVLITMQDGTQHRVETTYNESIFQTHDRVLTKLEL